MKASGPDLEHNPPAGRATAAKKLAQSLAQVWEEPSVRGKQAKDRPGSLDAPVLRAPNCPREAAGTLNLFLRAPAVTGMLCSWAIRPGNLLHTPSHHVS